MMYHFFELSILPFQGRADMRTENVVHSIPHNDIRHKKEKSEEKHRHNDHECCPRYFTSRRPRYIIKLFPRIFEKIDEYCETILSPFRKNLSFASLRKRIAGPLRLLSRNGDLKLAGQEGLEPPTCGFGDRRSTIRATGLYPYYFHNAPPSLSEFPCAACERGNDYRTS